MNRQLTIDQINKQITTLMQEQNVYAELDNTEMVDRLEAKIAKLNEERSKLVSINEVPNDKPSSQTTINS